MAEGNHQELENSPSLLAPAGFALGWDHVENTVMLCSVLWSRGVGACVMKERHMRGNMGLGAGRGKGQGIYTHQTAVGPPAGLVCLTIAPESSLPPA